MIAMVVAMAHGNVIGVKNDLPWHLPADLRHFKQLTTGKTVVMGRTTFDSIVRRLGKPLPNRRNVVLTHNPLFKPEGAEVVHDIRAVQTLAPDVYIIGGAQIYAAAFGITTRLYVTEVDADIAGDTYFPFIEPTEWREISREKHHADQENTYDYDFVIYDRR